MPNNLLVLPLIIPLAAAIFGLLTRHSHQAQRVIGVLGAGGLLASALALLSAVNAQGILALQIGNWPAPFGITLVADLLSAIMVTLTGLMGLLVMIYSLASIDPEREAFGYFPLLLMMLMGVNGAFWQAIFSTCMSGSKCC